MEIIKYILGNIIKRPVRAAFILSAGILSGLVLVFVFSLGLRVSENNKKDIIAKMTGQVWVPSNTRKLTFEEGKKGQYTKEAEIIRNYLTNHVNTRKLVGWYMGMHEVQMLNTRVNTLISATDFDADSFYRDRTELVEGAFPTAEQRYCCLITTGLVEKYKLKVGDSLTCFIPSAFGARNAMDFVITGIFRPSAPYYEGVTIGITDFNEMAELTGISPYYKAYVKDEKLIPDMVKELKSRLTVFPFEAYTDNTFIRSLLLSGTSTIIFFGGMALILFFALLIGINAVIITDIFDRRNEIGTLRALGFPRGKVRNIFFGENMILLLIGYLIGALIVTGIAVYFEFHLIRPPLLVLEYFFGMTRMGLSINVSSLIVPFLLLFGIMTLTTFRTIGKETRKKEMNQFVNN